MPHQKTAKVRRTKRMRSRRQRGGRYEIDKMKDFFEEARHVIIELDDMSHSKYRTRDKAKLIGKLDRLSGTAKNYLTFLIRETQAEAPDNQNEYHEYQEYRALRRKFEKFFEYKDKLDPPLSSLINKRHSLFSSRKGIKSSLYTPGIYTNGLGNYNIFTDTFEPYEDPSGHGVHGNA